MRRRLLPLVCAVACGVGPPTDWLERLDQASGLLRLQIGDVLRFEREGGTAGCDGGAAGALRRFLAHSR